MVGVVRAAPAGRSPGATLWEADLCGRMIMGDEAALAEVYDQYSSYVYGLAARVTADRRAAEDVTQEVFSYVWQRPEQFDPSRGSLRSWLGVITHRRAVDWVRHEASGRRAEARLGEEAIVAPDVEELATSLLTAERVRAAVSDLPAEQRRLVELTWFQGRTYREAASDEGLPEGTVKARLRRALQAIAVVLDDERTGTWA
jgi:RNA polymerase sigma-70 factor (ECF subfamily)